ncbi:MAG: hypothetical protein V2A78_00765 [bacterium]
MKKIGFFILVLLVPALALALYFSLGTSPIPLPFNSDKNILTEKTLHFLEDIRYKDFAAAAACHSPEEQKKVNIPELIERIFQIKPEFLDLMRYEISGLDIDSTSLRARVKTHSTVKILNTGEIRQPDVIFYWHKAPDGNWYLKLESSLR